MAKKSSLPPGLLSEFVEQHYAEPLRAGAYKKFSGNPNLVPLRDPSGQVRLTTKAQRQQLPDTFLGTEGVVGGYRSPTPRLNPNEYEFAQNRVGMTYARPRDEFTGLDPQSVADVKAFDKLTELQGQRIQGSYDAYAEQAGADRDRGTQALGDLARLAGTGFSGVEGLELSQAERALPGVLAKSASDQSAAASAQTIAAMNTLPTVARSEGLGAAERFRAERFGQRSELLSNLRGMIAESQAAQASQEQEQAQFQQRLSADLRGQNLNYLGTLSGQNVTAENNLLDYQTDILGLEQRAASDQADAQRQATTDQFRTPAKLKAAGFSLGPWRVKPKPRSGITYEQGSDGLWRGKRGKGTGGAEAGGVDQNTRQRAIADMRSDLGVRIPVREQNDQEKAAGTPAPSQGLSASDVARAISNEYDVPIAWAYDQARGMGYHHRSGEWLPPKWKGSSNTARKPSSPGADVSGLLGGL